MGEMIGTDVTPDAPLKKESPAIVTSAIVTYVRRRIGGFFANTTLALIMLVAIFPVLWTVMNAFKTGRDIFTFPPKFIFKPTLDNFRSVFSEDIATPLYNTLVITVGSVTLALVAGSLAGYALARFRSGVFKALGLFVFSMRFLPTIVILLPLFILYVDLSLIGTRVGLILAYQLFALPLSIWITWGFFAQVPVELEDAAMIDGCSRFQAFRHITLPLALPGIGAAAVVVVIFAWNQFLIPFILGGKNGRVITTEIARFSGGEDAVADWGPLAALAVVIAGPVVAAGFGLNRYLMRGLLREGGDE